MGTFDSAKDTTYAENIADLDRSAKRMLSIVVPNDDFFELRDLTRRLIVDYLRETVDPTVTLHIFGSSANLFGAAGADLDMCASLSPQSLTELSKAAAMQAHVTKANDSESDDEVTITQTPWRLLICAIGDVLRRHRSARDVMIRDTARVPIVLFSQTDSGLDCDISTHNALALRNTQLLRAYASIDWRVRAVAYIVKLWAKSRHINSPIEGTLSSYGYVLCVIFFLQAITNPPLLPSLQLLHQNWPSPLRRDLPARTTQIADHPLERSKKVDLYFYPVSGNPEDPAFAALRANAKRNTLTVAELVAGFFHYFAWRFDARLSAVSVQYGRPVLKALKQEHAFWQPTTRLAIEDPFEPWYDVAHVLKQHKYRRIRLEFMRAHDILCHFRPNANVSDILQALLQPSGTSSSADHHLAKLRM